MNAARSVKKRLDYQVLHSTGEKIEKKVNTQEDQSQESPPETLDQSLSSAFCSLSITEATSSESDSEDQVNEELRFQLEFNQNQVQDRQFPNSDVMDVSADLLAEELAIAEDIDDFMEENIVKEIGNNVNDHDLICRQIEESRTTYRTKHNKLKSSVEAQEYKLKYEKAYLERIESIKTYIKAVKAQRKNLRDGEDMKAQDVSKAKADKFKFIEKEIRDSITRLENVFNINEDDWVRESECL